MKFPRVPRQAIALSVIFAIVIAAFIISRKVLVPPTFGEYGHYRGQAVADNRAHGMKYAGAAVCAQCHEDEVEEKQQSYHRGLSCEVCHGPAAAHAAKPDDESLRPGAPRGRGYCPICHDYNPSRPTGFPQIIEVQHNPGKACMSCHDPHDPTPPHTPEQCSACHRQISSIKLVSHHSSLACTRCHTVPEEHAKNPRGAPAGKPKDRAFCGQCHDRKADSPREIPRIDLRSHGGRYACWDCHYPHFPEANR